MILDKMVRARRQYHHQNHHSNNNPTTTSSAQTAMIGNLSTNHSSNYHRHALNHHFNHRNNRQQQAPSATMSNNQMIAPPKAPSNTTQFIMNDHELIEPDFDLMHNAIMEHYNRSKKRKLNQLELQQDHQRKLKLQQNTESPSPKSSSAASVDQKHHHHNLQPKESNLVVELNKDSENEKFVEDEVTKKSQQQQPYKQDQPLSNPTTPNRQQSKPTTPSHWQTNSPGDDYGMSPFINHEHLQNEFQEVYTNIHTERLSSMSKNQLVNEYLLLEERVEELENQLRESNVQRKSS